MMPGIRILDWLVEEGVEVLSPEALRADPVCRCLGGLCFHYGIVGPMTLPQQESYCQRKEDFPPPILERARKFLRASVMCPPYEMEDTDEEESRATPLAERVRCFYRALEQNGLALR